NAQEKRNGRFFGLFKDASYNLALKHLEFWRSQGVFTDRTIARMLEVELTSELLIAGLDGMQDKKKSIDSFYRDLEDEYPTKDRDESRFKATVDEINEAFNGDLQDSEFRRPPLFYTLYCVVFHHLFGLPHETRRTPKRRLSKEGRDDLGEAV